MQQQQKKPGKPTSHIAKVFREGKRIDAAVKRAVRKATRTAKR